MRLRRSIIMASFLVASTGQPLLAQEQEKDDGMALERNSEACGFTYFTDKADNLDLRGTGDVACFDLKGGDDILILNRDLFPQGAQIYSGTGRDMVWATDGPDLIQDKDGEDREIRAFGGDDIIQIHLGTATDPARRLTSTQRTDLFPGTGNNRVEIGGGITGDAVARVSPDLWMVSEAGATDTVVGTCGRPAIVTDGYDIRSTAIPETTTISYDLSGCDLGVFGLYGDADITMKGGRLALQTYSEGFRVPAGENLPLISGEIVGGTGLVLDLDKSAPESNLTWEGSGSAFLRSRIHDPQSGGRFALRSAREVHYQGDLAAGDLQLDLAAQSMVRLDLVARGKSGSNRFSIAASRMDIAWRLDGEGGFPQIINDVPVTYMETSFILPQMPLIAARPPSDTPVEAPATEATGDDEETEEAADSEADESAPDEGPTSLQIVQTERVIEPGQTRLRIELRRDNDRFARCVSVSVVDMEGRLPEQSARCTGALSSLERIVLPDAAGYEMIRIKGDGVDLEIPINAASRFRVNQLEVQL